MFETENMHTFCTLQALDARRSVPSRQLGEPGPDEATLLRMLQSASRVLLGKRMRGISAPLKRAVVVNEGKWFTVDLLGLGLSWVLVVIYVWQQLRSADGNAQAVLLGTVFMMALANHFTQSAFDRALLDDAYAIASHLRADDEGKVALQLTDSELKAALFDQAEYVYYAVYRSDGSQLAGEPLPLLPWDESEPVSYRETLYNGQLVRAVALRSAVGEQQLSIVMMHTTRVRDSLIQHLFLYAAIPQLTLLVLLLWWLHHRIGQDMAPLAALQRSLSRRDAQDLAPIPPSAPATTREIEQLRQTTNALLARIADNVEAQREFAGNVAHEVRTPLAGIKALADYGLGHADPAVQQQQLQRISDSVARASHLVDQLLLLALSDEASAVQLAPVAAAEQVQQAVLRHWDAASRARIDLGAEGLDTAEAEQLPAAAAYGLGVVSYSPLARGVLTAKYPNVEAAEPGSRAARLDKRMLETEWRPESIDIAAEIKRHTDERGISPVDFALAWVLNNRLVTAAIAGPRTPEQWDSYIRALDYQFTADDEALVNRLVAAGHPSTLGFTDPGHPVEGRVPYVAAAPAPTPAAA